MVIKLPPDSSGLFIDGEVQDHNLDESSFTQNDIGKSVSKFDLSTADASNVEDMSFMFVGAESFDRSCLFGWDLALVDEGFSEEEVREVCKNLPEKVENRFDGISTEDLGKFSDENDILKEDDLIEDTDLIFSE